jgi:hypothetical protein
LAFWGGNALRVLKAAHDARSIPEIRHAELISAFAALLVVMTHGWGRHADRRWIKQPEDRTGGPSCLMCGHRPMCWFYKVASTGITTSIFIYLKFFQAH